MSTARTILGHRCCLLLLSLFFCTSPKAQQVVDFSTIPNNLLSSGSDTLKINTFPGYRIEIVRDEKSRARSLRIYEENGIEVTVTLGRKIALLTQTPGGLWQLDNQKNYPKIYRKYGGPHFLIDKKGYLHLFGIRDESDNNRFNVSYDRKGFVYRVDAFSEDQETLVSYIQYKPDQYVIWHQKFTRGRGEIVQEEVFNGRFMP